MQLTDLLKENGIDPFRDHVLVLRHRPSEPELRKKFRWVAEERPHLFNTYQSTQGPTVESALQKARYVASFFGHEPRKAVLVGLFEVKGSKVLSFEAFWKDKANKELRVLGMRGLSGKRKHVLKFQLDEIEKFRNLKGKLIVGWPGSDRAWSRWAHKKKNIFSITALLEESKLKDEMPDWTEIVLNHGELKIIPRSWRHKMEEWRGIYYIFDNLSGKGYVGSAYGNDNIFGRWADYARTVHGNNKHLRLCDADDLVFSILEIDSHDREREEIIMKESSWKRRLHTRHPNGLNAN